MLSPSEEIAHTQSPEWRWHVARCADGPGLQQDASKIGHVMTASFWQAPEGSTPVLWRGISWRGQPSPVVFFFNYCLVELVRQGSVAG